MITFLDLLMILSMVLIAVGFLSSVLMFLIRNEKVQRVCFYITVALGLYMGYVGVQINWPGFLGQVVLAVVLALISLGALLLERIRKNDSKMFLFARIAACAALAAGIVNALLI